MSSSPFTALSDTRDTPPYFLSATKLPYLLLHRHIDTRQQYMQTLWFFHKYVWVDIKIHYKTLYLSCHSSLPEAAGLATAAECTSSPRAPEPPLPLRETHSCPGAQRATQTGSKSGSESLLSALYTVKWNWVSERKSKDETYKIRTEIDKATAAQHFTFNTSYLQDWGFELKLQLYVICKWKSASLGASVHRLGSESSSLLRFSSYFDSTCLAEDRI